LQWLFPKIAARASRGGSDLAQNQSKFQKYKKNKKPKKIKSKSKKSKKAKKLKE